MMITLLYWLDNTFTFTFTSRTKRLGPSLKLIMMSAGSDSDSNYNNLVQMPNHDGKLPFHLLLFNASNINSGNINTNMNDNFNTLLQAAQMLVRANPESASIPGIYNCCSHT
jgi:hypothetical protein